MSSSRASTFHSHRGSSIVSSWAIRASSMASPPSGKADPLAGQVAELEALISCVTPGLGVDRPRLLPGEVEPAQQPPDPALAVADAEAALDQLAQVAGAPRHAAVALQPRTPQDQALQGGLLPLVERAGPARPRPGRPSTPSAS